MILIEGALVNQNLDYFLEVIQSALSSTGIISVLWRSSLFNIHTYFDWMCLIYILTMRSLVI